MEILESLKVGLTANPVTPFATLVAFVVYRLSVHKNRVEALETFLKTLREDHQAINAIGMLAWSGREFHFPTAKASNEKTSSVEPPRLPDRKLLDSVFSDDNTNAEWRYIISMDIVRALTLQGDPSPNPLDRRSVQIRECFRVLATQLEAYENLIDAKVVEPASAFGRMDHSLSVVLEGTVKAIAKCCGESQSLWRAAKQQNIDVCRLDGKTAILPCRRTEGPVQSLYGLVRGQMLGNEGNPLPEENQRWRDLAKAQDDLKFLAFFLHLVQTQRFEVIRLLEEYRVYRAFDERRFASLRFRWKRARRRTRKWMGGWHWM